MPKSFLINLLAFLSVLLALSACGTSALGAAENLALDSGLLKASLTQTSLPTLTYTVTPTPFQPLPTETRTPVPSFTPIPTRSATPTLPPAATPSLTPTASLPSEFILSNFYGHRQYLTLDCEASAAADWANFFGKNINELDFQTKLPRSDNPDFGFVGSPYAPWGQVPPLGYGVYAGPVADLLNKLGVPAKAHKAYTFDQLKATLARGKPVIAWVIGNVVSGIPSDYTDSEGRGVTVAVYEHVVIITGYTENYIYYVNGGILYITPTSLFQKSWEVLGNMVVTDQ